MASRRFTCLSSMNKISPLPAAGSELPRSLHMLNLPPPAISISSIEGRVTFLWLPLLLPLPILIDVTFLLMQALFGEALLAGTATGSLQLLQAMETQKEFRSCGLASLCAVLNALNVDPGVTWKGHWRWYDESMLASPETLTVIKQYGMSLQKLSSVAANNKLDVGAFHASGNSLEEFVEMISTCASSGTAYTIVNYSRSVLNQVGGAHYAPLAAYHRERDMVLLLDVAKFKYPSHWVPSHLLWDAMNTTVQKTGKTRGYMVCKRKEQCKENHK